MAAQDSGTQAEHAATVGPGARLRARRESLGWSVEQVADKLYLDARYIRALEQDRHAEIAAPVFVRGYLRSYALLLQLPADAIVECYTAADADSKAAFSGPAQFNRITASSSARARGWVILALLVGVAGVVAYVWRAPWVVVGDSPPAQVEVSPSAAAPGPGVAPAMAPESDFDAAFPSSQPTAPESALSLPADAAPGNSPFTSSAKAERRLADAPQGVLVLRFNADSWAMVSDATGKELMYELVPGGSSRALEAVRPPLQVVLGNSPAVTVEYNGKHFDQSRYSRNRVARFTLGGTEAP